MTTAQLDHRTQAALTLFAEHLPDIKFPDVDAATLAAAAHELTQAREALAQREAEVQEARRVLEARQSTLQQLAARGLAYAKVYADSHEGLRETIDSLLGARSEPKAAAEGLALVAPKKRGRPPKAKVDTDASLLAESGAAREVA